MFIEIEKDILDDAIEKVDYDINPSRDLLLAMALCAKHGKHYVVVSALRNNVSLKSELAKLLGKAYVSMLDYSNRRFQDTMRLKEKLCIRTIITLQKQKEEQPGVIIVNPLEKKDFEPWTETFVLTENLMDSVFYEQIVRYYKRKQKIQKCKNAFYPLMGGGVTIAKVMASEIERARHFCLAIADSDKKYPEDKIGKTAELLQDTIASSPFNASVYVLKKVMEIENLIPRHLVVECCTEKGYIEIFNKDPSFFDMKKGLSLGCLFNGRVCEYWKGLITDEEKRFKERDEKIRNCKNETDYQKKIRDSKIIKKGFGGDLLDRVLSKMRMEQPQVSRSLYEIEDRYLNNFQQDEWFNIGQIMFAWTCACNAS